MLLKLYYIYNGKIVVSKNYSRASHLFNMSLVISTHFIEHN